MSVLENLICEAMTTSIKHNIFIFSALIFEIRVKDSNTIAGAKKDSYTITKIYIP
jgi:hypothetical protein